MRKLLLSLVSFVALCALVGCGSSNTSIAVPPNPSGGNAVGFTNASLAANKSYVYAVSGSTVSNNFAVVGTFVTDGNGTITAGTRDTANDGGGQALDEPITGTYSINADGRGQAVINGPAAGQVIYRFVLHTPTVQQPSLVGEFFQDGTTSSNVIVDAVGTIQQVSGTPATPTGTYIVRLDGEDPNLNLYGAVGGITFTGNTIAGFIDENDNGTYTQETQPLAANGTVSLAASRGTATLVTPGGINTGTHNFAVYFVSPTQLQLVSTDPRFFLYGNAAQQTSFAASNAAFAGDQVFSLSGFDSTPGPRAETGRITLNGDGTLSNAIEDYIDAANVFPGGSLTLNSTYSVGATGRWTANLLNATYASSTGLVGWQVAFGPGPQDQKSFIISTNSTILETGVMLGQTLGLNDASVAGNYAESFAGVSVTGPNSLELTGNLDANGAGSFTSGKYDAQTDSGGLTLDAGATGTYTIDPVSGRSTNASLESFPVSMYAVDADTIYVISTQQGSIYQGALVSQQ
jgi:hypothetical protein